MLAHSFTVIFTNDTITHKGKINVLSFRPLKKREKKKKNKGKMDYWPLCKE